MQETQTTYYKTPIGIAKIIGNENGIQSVSVLNDDAISDKLLHSKTPVCLQDCVLQLDEYFSGKRKEFDIKIYQEGTEFQQKVWNELVKIPHGKIVSYNYIAERVGGKNMMRAVGSANGKNQISIIVPCHRVIGSDGSLTGYAGGMWRKEWLLKHEDKYSNEERQLGLFG